MPIPNQNGMGFYYAISQDIENKYTKLIYLTVGEWHQELLQIGGKMDVTVISIVEGDGEIRMTEERRCRLSNCRYNTLIIIHTVFQFRS